MENKIWDEQDQLKAVYLAIQIYSHESNNDRIPEFNLKNPPIWIDSEADRISLTLSSKLTSGIEGAFKKDWNIFIPEALVGQPINPASEEPLLVIDSTTSYYEAVLSNGRFAKAARPAPKTK